MYRHVAEWANMKGYCMSANALEYASSLETQQKNQPSSCSLWFVPLWSSLCTILTTCMQVFTWSSGISPNGSITQHFRFGSSSALGAPRKKQDHVELG